MSWCVLSCHGVYCHVIMVCTVMSWCVPPCHCVHMVSTGVYCVLSCHGVYCHAMVCHVMVCILSCHGPWCMCNSWVVSGVVLFLDRFYCITILEHLYFFFLETTNPPFCTLLPETCTTRLCSGSEESNENDETIVSGDPSDKRLSSTFSDFVQK